LRTVGRALRRPRLGVDVGAAVSLVGTLLKYMSLSALLPTGIALGYSEPFWPFLAAGAACAAGGWLLERSSDPGRAGMREGFLVVALVWLLAAVYGALPFVFAGEGSLASPMNAFFESMSGFTTTGSTVLADYDGLPHSLMMWRQFTQWLGGMGILVVFFAVLPRLRVGGRQMLEHELPGPEMEPLRETIRSTSGRFLVLYLALSGAQVVVLTLFGWTGIDPKMGPYEAVAHTFTTLSTGGFSTEPTSLGAFGASTQWVVVVFMFLGGTNFALLFRGLVRRQPRAFARDDEFRLYVAVAGVGSAILVADLLNHAIATSGEAAVRHAVFQTLSIMTTTGFASADYNLWSPLAAVTIVGLMFLSASAGSTAGGIKLVRHVLIGRLLRRELEQTIHPEMISPLRLNGRVVDERTLRAVTVFVLLYMAIFALGALGLVVDSARAGIAVTPFEAIAAAATTLANVGPGFGFAGPYGSFEPYSDLSKAIMIALMWLGRLEIVPIVILFTRSYWRG
jgi:trk system potassium uptake protein TrkH